MPAKTTRASTSRGGARKRQSTTDARERDEEDSKKLDGEKAMLTRLTDDGIDWVEDVVSEAPQPKKPSTTMKKKKEEDSDVEIAGEFWDDLDHESCGYGPIDDVRADAAGEAIEASLYTFNAVLSNGAANAAERREAFEEVYSQLIELANAFGRGPEHGPQQFCEIDFDKDAWFAAEAYTRPIVLLHFKTNSLGLKNLKELIYRNRSHRAKSDCWDMIREYCGAELFDKEMVAWNRVVYAAHGSADSRNRKACKGIRLTTKEMRSHSAFKYFDVAHDMIINLLRGRCIVTFGSRDSERFERDHERCRLPEFIMVDDEGNDRTFTAAAHPSYLLRHAFTYGQTTSDAGHFATAGQAFGMIMNDFGKGLEQSKRLKNDMSKLYGVEIKGEFVPWTAQERIERAKAAKTRWMEQVCEHNALGWTNGQLVNACQRFEGHRLDHSVALLWTPTQLRSARERFEGHRLDHSVALLWTPTQLRSARDRFERNRLDVSCALLWTPNQIANARRRFEGHRLDHSVALLWTPTQLRSARRRFEGHRLDHSVALLWTPIQLKNARDRFERNRLDHSVALLWTPNQLRSARQRFERNRLDVSCALLWTPNQLKNARDRFARNRLDHSVALLWTPTQLSSAHQRFERNRRF